LLISVRYQGDDTVKVAVAGSPMACRMDNIAREIFGGLIATGWKNLFE